MIYDVNIPLGMTVTPEAEAFLSHLPNKVTNFSIIPLGLVSESKKREEHERAK